MNRSTWVMLFVALAVTTGCESKSVPAGVSGNITLGGAPLDGSINFISNSASQQPAATSNVTGGKYSVPVEGGLTMGSYRVEISSLPSGDAPTAAEGSSAPSRELVPARYNSKSDLTAHLKGGGNTADFDLKPK